MLGSLTNYTDRRIYALLWTNVLYVIDVHKLHSCTSQMLTTSDKSFIIMVDLTKAKSSAFEVLHSNNLLHCLASSKLASSFKEETDISFYHIAWVLL